MKFVTIQFQDSVDTSSLTVDKVVTVGTVTGGTVTIAGTMQNPTAGGLTAHTHTTTAGVTGPATPTT